MINLDTLFIWNLIEARNGYVYIPLLTPNLSYSMKSRLNCIIDRIKPQIPAPLEESLGSTPVLYCYIYFLLPLHLSSKVYSYISTSLCMKLCHEKPVHAQILQQMLTDHEQKKLKQNEFSIHYSSCISYLFVHFLCSS